MKSFNIDSLPVDNTIKSFIKRQADIAIDKYSLKGGNGVLFFGLNKILEKRVALKFYFIDGSTACHAEPKTLGEIKDLNILPIFDAGTISNEYAFFITPEIDGGDLDNYIIDEKLNLFSVIKIVKGVLSGLTCLHSASSRLIHRDLKPSNILVDKNCTPYIADFGSIVKLPENGKYIRGPSRHTIIYTPPETFKQNCYYISSDIYQVGILLYQLLGGYFPYQALAWLTKKEKLTYQKITDDFKKSQYFNQIFEKKVCKGQHLDYETLPNFIPLHLKKMVKKATNRDYKKRYQITSEFLADIHKFMSSALNWIVLGDNEFLVQKFKPHKLRLKISKKSNHWCVEKSIKSGWRRDNTFSGNLKHIAEKIHKEYYKFK
ncbi:MAG: protein kinase [Candidatus Omnitrophota bacterium]